MIRAVIDTNIIVSALFWGGAPRAVLNAARAKRFQMITSKELIDELRDVISRPKFAERLAQVGDTVDSLLETDYHALVEVVDPAQTEPIIADDPDDNALIACALGGAADYIISGDHHLLDLGEYQGIKLWTANRFLEEAVER
ncbi:MAG: putative toxin-antitoxin system toxin component, PIN family [Anaerolineae bacterium]|nr:putative toxin-antitoxin system toxin component, PIN family [Anaerolineae bacterium]